MRYNVGKVEKRLHSDPLSPTLSTSSVMRTPENTEEDPDDLNQQMKEISK